MCANNLSDLPEIIYFHECSGIPIFCVGNTGAGQLIPAEQRDIPHRVASWLAYTLEEKKERRGNSE